MSVSNNNSSIAKVTVKTDEELTYETITKSCDKTWHSVNYGTHTITHVAGDIEVTHGAS